MRRLDGSLAERTTYSPLADASRRQRHRVRRVRAGPLARQRSPDVRAGLPLGPRRHRRAGQLLAARRACPSACCRRVAASCAAASASSRSGRRSPSARSRSTTCRPSRDLPANGDRYRRARHLRARHRRRPEDAGEHRRRPSPGTSDSAGSSSSRRRICIATARTRTSSIRIRPRRADAVVQRRRRSTGRFETTGRYLASEHRDLTVSYVRSHSTRDLNDYDQFFGNFRNPIIRANENSLSPTDVPNRLIVRGTIGLPGKWVFVAALRMAVGISVVGRQRVPGFRRPAQPVRAAAVRVDARLHARPAVAFREIPLHRRPQDLQRVRHRQRARRADNITSPDYGKFYNPIQRSIGFVFSGSKP